MVKVIDDTPDQSVVKRTVCRNCGCTLEYVPLDVQKRKVTDYTGCSDTYKYIKCPKCSHEVYV